MRLPTAWHRDISSGASALYGPLDEARFADSRGPALRSLAMAVENAVRNGQVLVGGCRQRRRKRLSSQTAGIPTFGTIDTPAMRLRRSPPAGFRRCHLYAERGNGRQQCAANLVRVMRLKARMGAADGAFDRARD